MLMVSIGAGGCQSTSGQQGQDRAITAGYSFGTLTCDLGIEVTTEQVASAAEESLRLRGYSVTSRTVTADHARVVGKSAGDGWLKQAVIESNLTAEGNRLRVRAEPWGNESMSRAILDSVLSMMGR